MTCPPHLPAWFSLLLLLVAPAEGRPQGDSAAQPNILVVLADDLGIGDLGCYNPASKVPTPHLDRLASEGLRLTHAHSPSAVCTPTRYGLLTGRYAWRTHLKRWVLGAASPNLIDPQRVTLPELLQAQGYRTGIAGKWHLGLGEGERTDFSGPIYPAPIHHGFDFSWIIPASLDMAPYVYVLGDRVIQPATEQVPASQHRRQGGGGFWRGGAIAPDFRHMEVQPRTRQRAVEFMERHVREREGQQPFFLYVPLSGPHTPWLPTEAFQGASGAGHYGDFVVQCDDLVGELLATLERLGVADETLVVVTSDNGSHWPDADIQTYGHDANLGLRGQKADVWEGGTRVPLLVRWPGRVPAGRQDDALWSHVDLTATLLGVLGQDLPDDAAEDSLDQSPVWLGHRRELPPREHLVTHSGNGQFAYREGPWKLCEGLGSGGFTEPKNPEPQAGGPTGQLYHLERDPAEQHNLWLQEPETVARLQANLEALREAGRTRPKAPVQDRPGFISFAEGDPDLERGLHVNEPGATDGLLLVAPLNGTSTYLVEMDGSVVHQWQHDSSPGGFQYLLDDGSLLRCGRVDDDPKFRGGGVGGWIQRVAPDGELLWNWRLADEREHQHHDIQPLPNGNLLVVAWERIEQVDALRAGRDRNHVGKAGLWPDQVLEVRPVLPDGAEVVWRWRAWDHRVQDANPDRERFGYPADHPGRIDVNVEHRDEAPLSAEQRAALEARSAGMAALGYVGDDEEDPDDEQLAALDRSGDWMHTNAVAYHPGYQLIVLSSPELNEVFIIDHSTTTEEAAGSTGGRWGRGGELLWRWGNPRNYGAGSDSDRRLWYQHDPTFVEGPDGSLRLLVFNNGSGRPEKSFSSVLELELPFDPQAGFQRTPGHAFGPSEPAWSFQDPDGFYSAFISGCQRLWSGNTLVCSGAAGRVFEVTPAGQVVWDWFSPLGGDVTPPDHAGKAPPLALFRASRLPRDHPGLGVVLAGR